MNYNKINKNIEEQHNKHLEKVLSNIAIFYKINKKELFNKFLNKQTNVKVYKNKKKILEPAYKCMGRKQDGTQCSRGKKFGDYCGKHNPPKFGRIDEPINNALFKKKQNHILVKTEHINGKEYIMEESTNILFDSNIKQPTVIGKKLSENSIFFIDEVNNLKEAHKSSHLDPSDIEDNNIVNILKKLTNKSVDEEYEKFNMNTVDRANEQLVDCIEPIAECDVECDGDSHCDSDGDSKLLMM